MHELSLCRSISAIAARAAGGRQVVRVALDIGVLRQVVVPTLEYCWSLVSQDSPLEGSQLEVAQVSAAVRCDRCGEEWAVASHPSELVAPEARHANGFACTACGPGPVTVLSGEEFLVRSIDVRD